MREIEQFLGWQWPSFVSAGGIDLHTCLLRDAIIANTHRLLTKPVGVYTTLSLYVKHEGSTDLNQLPWEEIDGTRRYIYATGRVS